MHKRQKTIVRHGTLSVVNLTTKSIVLPINFLLCLEGKYQLAIFIYNVHVATIIGS